MSGTQIYLKKLKTFKVFVAVIVPLVMLLSFLGSSVRASADTVIPVGTLVPDVSDPETGEVQVLSCSIIGNYDSFKWQYRNVGIDSWTDISLNMLVYNLNNHNQFDEREYRVAIFYYDENVLETTYSNSVFVYNSSLVEVNQYTFFTGTASVLLSRFLQWFDLALDWMLNNPIVFVFLVFAIIISSIGMLRHLIGGVYAKEKEKHKEKDIY